MKPISLRIRTIRSRSAPQSSLPKHFEASLLDGAQGADEREQRRLSRPGRPGHDHDLATAHFQIVFVQGLFAEFPLAKVVIEGLDFHRLRHLDAAGECSTGCGNGRL